MIRAMFLVAVLLVAGTAIASELLVRDDMNRAVSATKPARRIISLEPFLSEFVVAAGAGRSLIAISEDAEHPSDLGPLPAIPTGRKLSIQRIIELKPDLILASPETIRPDDADRIDRIGIPLFFANNHYLEDVPRILRAVGILTGREVEVIADRYERKLEDLRRVNAIKQKLGVFLEIQHRPLISVSGGHFLSQALEICRADSIFKESRGIMPEASWEQIASRSPFAIVGMGSAHNLEEFLRNWNLRQSLTAVRQGRLVFVDTNSVRNPSLVSADDVEHLCEGLDKVRATIPGGPASS